MSSPLLNEIVKKYEFDISDYECCQNDIKLVVAEHALYDFLKELYNMGSYHMLLDITAVDYSEYKKEQKNRFAIVYILRHQNFVNTITVKSLVSNPNEGVKSVIDIYKCANWLEREVWDQYGVNFQNHPNLKRILNHHEFVGHPLRKDYPITKGQLCTKSDDLMDEIKERLFQKGLISEKERGDTQKILDKFMFLNLGPSHPASHGTIRTLCALDGETIVLAVSEIGYLHRGFEKSCENHTYNQIIPYTDRLNYLSAITNNVAFVKTIEEMLDIKVPDRAIFVRVILMELSRIIDHLVCLGANLVDMGALTNYWYLFNPRESVNLLFSKLTGARLTNSYLRVGGMAHDFYDGFENDLLLCLKEIEKGVSDTLTLVEKNRIFHDRTQNICTVSAKEALERGFCGPNLRASGVAYDMRVNNPYYYYDSFDFDMVIGSSGDIYDRLMVRFEEIKQSMGIIRQALLKLPKGAINIDNHAVILPNKERVYNTIEGTMNHFKLIFEGVKVPLKEHYSSLEAPNGELGFFVVSDGSGTPYKVKVRAPSFFMMSNFADMIKGTMIADAVINLGSINIIAGELDR